MPRTGGFLVATNHASYLDPPAAGIDATRDLNYFARKTLFRYTLSRVLIQPLRVIPVDRDGPSDVGALKRVFRMLKSGEGLLVFPEGTRTRDGGLQEGRAGVGMLACKAGVPVVPGRIFGSFEAWAADQKPQLRAEIDVVYGPPIQPRQYDPGGKGRERFEIASQRIMDVISQIQRPQEEQY